MSLSPEEMQARIELAREINASTPADKVVGAVARLFDLDAVPGVTKFSDGPKKVEMNSILLAPVPITKDNLNVVIDAGWVSKDVVCQGVAAGTVPACG